MSTRRSTVLRVCHTDNVVTESRSYQPLLEGGAPDLRKARIDTFQARRRMLVSSGLLEDEEDSGGWMKRFVIFPGTLTGRWWLEVWDLYVLGMILLLCYFEPYTFALYRVGKEPDYFVTVNKLLNVTFTVDMVFQFFIAWPRSEDSLHKDLWESNPATLALHYLGFAKSETGRGGWFWLDLLAVVPCWMASIIANDNMANPLLMMRILRIFQSTRIVRLTKLQEFVHSKTGYHAIVFEFLKFLIITTLTCHWMACVWVMVEGKVIHGIISYYTDSATWLSALIAAKGDSCEPDASHDPACTYLLAFYWATMTLTGVGYGDITPQNNVEYGTSIICMTVTGYIWAYIVGTIVSILSNVDPENEEFKHHMNELNSLMHRRALPSDLQVRMRHYIYETTGMPVAEMEKKGGAQRQVQSVESAAGPAGKAAALASGTGAATGAFPQRGFVPVTAMSRAALTGSALATGPGARAEPAGPKAKAAAKAPTPVQSVTGYAAQAGPPPAAPRSVIDIVTGKPMPVLESSSNAAPARGPSPMPYGPALAYAQAAKQALAGVAGAKDLPKEGPPVVAVGRAMESGLSSPITVRDGKASVPINSKYQIVFVTSEVAPFSKTGGLGEAMDGLPVALAALGHRVMVISPRYDQYEDAWDTDFRSSVTMAGKEEEVHFFHTYKQKVDYVFCDHPTFLERVDGLTGAKLYGPDWGEDFADNQARYAYFCKAALIAVKELPVGGYTYGQEVVVVANDWHSALVPMFIHADRQANPAEWSKTKTAFLTHNAVFQGRFEYEAGLAQVFNVPQQYIDSIAFKMPLKVGKYNKKVMCVNTMAAGLLYADRALTVSPSYAKECATDPEKGVELQELFARGRVTGILNGVKEGVSPADKNFVTKSKMSCGTFTSATAVEAKQQLKAAYRQESGLPDSPGPLMCFIGRLDAQKGYDLLLEALVDVLADTELQVVMVGAGRADLVQQTKALAAKFPSKFLYAGWMGPERYALLAGCDYTLLPSRWEPCGLVQMEAMRCGTLPIVAPTGGLRDTVKDGVNGLWMDAEMTVEAELDEESSASIARSLRRAAELHIGSPAKEAQMKRAAMAAAAEYTWSNAALQYEAVFEELGAEQMLGKTGDRSVTLEVDRQVC